MDNVYTECMVKRDNTPADMAKRIGLILGMLILNAAALVLITTFFAIILAVSAWVSVIVWRRLSREYEYIYTDGNLDVDVIYHRTSRKRLVSIDCREFAIIAPAEDPEIKKQLGRKFDKNLDAGRGGFRENSYVAICNREGNTLKLIFEPNERILEPLKKYAPRILHYDKKVEAAK